MIVVKLSGNLASQYTGGTFTITGDAVAGRAAGGSIGDGGRVVVQPPVPGNGNPNGNEQVLLAAVFPIGAPVTNENDEVTLTVSLRRIGNGLDYTYSRVGRIKRDRQRNLSHFRQGYGLIKIEKRAVALFSFHPSPAIRPFLN